MKFPLVSLSFPLLLAACAAPPVAIGPRSTEPQSAATLVAGRRGEVVALKKNGTLTLEIQSNTTAGYRWKLAEPVDSNVLQLVSASGSELPPIALAPPEVSVPQTEKWVFKAVGPGTTKVRMFYSRFDQPLTRTVFYDFTVNAE